VNDDALPTRPVHIGRQAIYDRAGDVVAYELLFRDAADALDASRRGTYATSQVIVAAFTEFGIRELVGDRACFINVTREFLVGDLPLPFDAGQAGLEILADVPVDDELVEGVAKLAELGYSIAVDDFHPGQGREPLLQYANYAKIDMTDPNPTRIRSVIAPCAQYPHVQLVAERLETHAGMSVAFDLGFALFQGHVLGRPHLVSTQVLSPSRLHRLHLLTQLTSEDMNIVQVVATIETDPALALRVLRGVNAAATGIERKVSSIAEAVVMLGPRKIYEWVSLMLVADLAQGDEARLNEAVTCARLCQTLAERHGEAGTVAFTVGLLGAIGDLLDIPADELARQLPLTDEITDAVVHGRGELAAIVRRVRAYQRGESGDLGGDLLAAMRWTTGALRSTAAAGAAV
jgi:c-di-GMP-related signal transduction protein